MQIRTSSGQIQEMTPDQLQQFDPGLYSKYIESVGQPAASLNQTQTSTARTAADIPAVQAQTQAATQNIPVDTSTAPPTQDAIGNIKNTYQTAWKSAKTATQRDTIAQSFKQSTGGDLFNLYLPKDQIDPVTETLATKQQIDIVRKGMKDPKLKSVIGNPFNNLMVNLLQGAPGGPAMLQKIYGISDDGMAAMSSFIKLQSSGERQLVGGRLSGYMTQLFGKAQPGIGRSVSDNLNQLNTFSNQIDKNLNVVAKNNGFQKWQDVPGLSAYQTSDQPQPNYSFKKL